MTGNVDDGVLLRMLRSTACRKQRGRCYWCNGLMLQGQQHQLHPNYATAEHLVPVYAGGLTKPGNIVAACAKCNNERNTETNRTKIKGVVFTSGDDTPRSPFEKLKMKKDATWTS